MTKAALLTSLLITLLLSSTPIEASQHPDSRHLVKILRRQGTATLPTSGSSVTGAAGGSNNENGGGNNNAISSSSSENNGGGILDSLTSILDPTKSSTKSSSQTTVIVPPSSTSSSSATTSKSTVSSTKPLSTGPTVVQITQTSTISGPSSSLNSTALNSQSDTTGSGGSSGLSKGTLIAIIVVASAVGAVAAIWTIIRKWKLSPSRRFEDKLNPIDFVDDYGHDHSGANNFAADYGSTANLVGANGVNRNDSINGKGAGGLSRSGSNASSDLLHKREGSWGSGSVAGSQRGGHMTEALPYNNAVNANSRPIYPPQPQPWQQPPTNPYPYDYNGQGQTHNQVGGILPYNAAIGQHDPYAQYRY